MVRDDEHLLTIGHSPDSDDMVMWWPLVGMRCQDGIPVAGEDGRPAIDTEGLGFEAVADDVQRLNRRAIEVGDLDVTAISAHAYPHIAERYRITSSGASMGEGYGPKLVVREDSPYRSIEDALGGSGRAVRVAVPGVHTTAFLVLRLLVGWDFAHEEMAFDRVPDAVASGRVELGLLIHEAQLTFAELGLRPVADLGEIWQRTRGLPLPLGLNVVRRDVDDRLGSGGVERVARVLGRSIRHAVEHPEASRRFLEMHAEGRPEWRDPALVDRYLRMYVSDLTLDMGERGRGALVALFREAGDAGLIPDPGVIDVVGREPGPVR